MARVASGDAGELAVDARSGAARAGQAGAWQRGQPPYLPARIAAAGPARTERLRSWPMTSWARGGMSSAPEWQVVDHGDGPVGPGAIDLVVPGFIDFGDDGTGEFGF